MSRKLLLPLLSTIFLTGLLGAAPVPSREGGGATGAPPQQSGSYHAERPFGTLRQQAAIQQEWVRERLEVPPGARFGKGAHPLRAAQRRRRHLDRKGGA